MIDQKNAMKFVLAAIVILLSSVASVAQAPAAEEPQPGIAGHHDCRAYFGVLWLDGVPSGQTQQTTHFGLSVQQFEWWKSEGYIKARGLCYLPLAAESAEKLDLKCPGCSSDWVSRFRWVAFEHVDAKDKRSNVSGQIVTASNAGLGAGGRPTASLSASDPKSRVDYEVAVVSTGAAVYAPNNPIRPPTGQDPQLFYYAEEKDKSNKNAGAQVASNDRIALQAAAKFILKNVKR
jgi:hypothetical protein